MNYHTLSLNLLLLLATVYPTGFSYSANYIFRGTMPDDRVNFRLLGFIIVPLACVMAVIYILKRDILYVELPHPNYFLLALLAVPACIALEYFINKLYFYFTTGKWFSGIDIHSFWGSDLKILYVILIILIACGEEFVYRALWFSILGGELGVPIVGVLIITSLFYGFNHLYFGINSVIAKFASSIVYGCLFYFSGSIAIPILTHLVQNVALILVFGRKKSS